MSPYSARGRAQMLTINTKSIAGQHEEPQPQPEEIVIINKDRLATQSIVGQHREPEPNPEEFTVQVPQPEQVGRFHDGFDVFGDPYVGGEAVKVVDDRTFKRALVNDGVAGLSNGDSGLVIMKNEWRSFKEVKPNVFDKKSWAKVRRQLGLKGHVRILYEQGGLDKSFPQNKSFKYAKPHFVSSDWQGARQYEEGPFAGQFVSDFVYGQVIIITKN